MKRFHKLTDEALRRLSGDVHGFGSRFPNAPASGRQVTDRQTCLKKLIGHGGQKIWVKITYVPPTCMRSKFQTDKGGSALSRPHVTALDLHASPFWCQEVRPLVW